MIVEALVLGAVVSVALGQAQRTGVCGDACQAATPFLVLAAALCLAALAGIVAIRWLARSSLLNEPDRFVTLLALGLPATVIPILVAVVLTAGGNPD